jgi:alpha,alpha-trehalase
MQQAEYFHIESLSPLYEAVQRSGIFADSKFFPDCLPKSEPADILAAYENARGQADFDLRRFVEAHFEVPHTPETGYESGQTPIRQHLYQLWALLTRQPEAGAAAHSTLLPLPHPYVVPGGRFREVYYWDSYFSMVGMHASGHTGLIRQMVDNFAHLIETLGFIPNGNRSYYLGRSQPPFFALMVSLLAEIEGEQALLRYRHHLEKEYDFWMAGAAALPDGPAAQQRVVQLADGTLLNRYWDAQDTPRPEAFVEDEHVAAASGRPAAEVYRHIRAAAESGWDFSSRWFADGQQMGSIHTCDLLPVDLNCLLYFLEKTLLRAYRLLPDRTPVEVLKEKSRKRRNAIQQYCWNAEQGFYVDYDFVKDCPSAHWTLAAVFPLFFQIATAEQAAAVAGHLEAQFLQAGGLRTTLRHSGQQWDAPNGWAPLQWMAYQGLLRYGHAALAERIRQRWLALNEKTYAQTGKMMEKYDVENPDAPGGGGEYPNQDGFGWTNGVYLGMEA